MKFLTFLVLLFCTALPARAAYRFQALGTFGGLRSEPTSISDLGRVAGLLTGA